MVKWGGGGVGEGVGTATNRNCGNRLRCGTTGTQLFVSPPGENQGEGSPLF